MTSFLVFFGWRAKPIALRSFCFFLIGLMTLPCAKGFADSPIRLGTFNVDASPPIGTMMAYDATVQVQTPLRCSGVVLLSDSKPIVLCSVDWIGISNDAMDFFRDRLAGAAGTSRDRVAIHAIHQHDAPAADFANEALLRAAGAPNVPFDGSSSRRIMEAAAVAVTDAVENAKPISHVGTAEAEVHGVASNRRVMGPDGKVLHIRWSAVKDETVRDFPEGVIDPKLKLVTFWDGDRAVAALSYYATHPQSYYRTGKANPDFPGLARNQSEQVQGVPHIHFNGAGGNITAGKYNDGSPENRQVLADRLAGAFRRAWATTQKQPLDSTSLDWKTTPVLLPPGESIVPKELDNNYAKAESLLLTQLQDSSLSTPSRYNIANKLLFLRRYVNKVPIDLSLLQLGGVRLLHMPGELFVEYQLAAQKMAPESFVCMAAYGEYSPFYIGTSVSYEEGGYETSSSATMVGPEAETILMSAMAGLLGANEPAVSSLNSISPLGVAKTDDVVAPIRIGFIGCDTSHVPAFADMFAQAQAGSEAYGFQIVAAFPGGSPDIPSSIDRVPQYTDHLRKMGVKIVGSVEELVRNVDVVLLTSVDGRPHLEQARPVILAGKRMFIDKPLAGSLDDAIEIFRLAKEMSVPVFSSSSLRFSPGIASMRSDARVGKVVGCNAYGPCALEEHHPDLFWYGIHGVETLFTIMGPGCKSVSRTSTPDTEMVVGLWKDGRVGSFRGIRNAAAGYGATVFGDKGIAQSGDYAGYAPLVIEIAKFFKTGVPPIQPEETLEIFRFMHAADESKRKGGQVIELDLP